MSSAKFGEYRRIIIYKIIFFIKNLPTLSSTSMLRVLAVPTGTPPHVNKYIIGRGGPQRDPTPQAQHINHMGREDIVSISVRHYALLPL